MNKNITHKLWLNIASNMAKASTCSTNVGCVLIRNNYIHGIGYNGSISGDIHCCDTDCLKVDNYNTCGKSGESCIRTIHAEMNAALKCDIKGSQKDGWLSAYITNQPCLNCFKHLLQLGVRNFYYIKSYRDINRDMYIKDLQKSFGIEVYKLDSYYVMTIGDKNE